MRPADLAPSRRGVLALLAALALLAGCGSDAAGGDSCGNTCPAGAVCERGVCVTAPCAPGFADCNHSPGDGCEIETGTDDANCGACGTPCTADHGTAVCTDGTCGITVCEPGFADCDHSVTTGCEQDIGSTLATCGGCETACAPTDATGVCEGGHCGISSCDPGHDSCDLDPANGCEVDVTDDPVHCGSCGHECVVAHASPACVDSQCAVGACTAGFDDCDHLPGNGCEADLAAVATCGACGTTCPTAPHATATCTGTGCGIACQGTYGNCDTMAPNGCETDLATDEAHCGACGAPCAGNETCSAGVCTTVACVAPLADCNDLTADGCETNVAIDVDNCGACGTECAFPHAVAACANGMCGFSTCDLGFGNCDGMVATGCESTLATDNANCGMCGNACPAGSTCSNGACTYACLGHDNDPITGQKCPIETPCTAYPQCGTQLGSPTFRYWYCSPTLHTCQYLPQSNGYTTAAGTCTGQLTFRQLASAPWDKRILPPNGVNFRVGTTLALEVTNTTAADIYLDQFPLTLELAGTNPSRFDVNSIHMYQVGSISDYGDGNNGTIQVCVSPTTPFAASSTFTLGTGATGGCGGSTFSRVRAGQSSRFIINLAFASSSTFITGRQYRLRIAAPLGGVKARPSSIGAPAAYTACTLPAAGITGSYLIFERP